MSKDISWDPWYGHGEIVCTCDFCGEFEVIDFGDGPDFKMAQEDLKSLGWVSRKIDNTWYDFCSEQCYYEWIKENK